MEPIAETEFGTAVFHLTDDVPTAILPKRSQPDPYGLFADYLKARLPFYPSVAIVRQGRTVRVFKVGKNGDVFAIQKRVIRKEDRQRLIEAGILPKC